MFEIEYKGANSVVISTKKTTIVTDPRLSVVGLKDLVIKDAIEIATEERFALNSSSAKLSLEGPGEYGFGEFDVTGIPVQRHLDSDGKLSTMYRIEVGDVRIGLIGNIYEKLSEDQLERLGVLDILILPVGGNGYTLDATGASTVTRQIDPKVVIPVHYADEGIKYEVPQGEFETFAKELGSPVETVSKYKVKQAASLPQSLTIVQVTRG